MDNGSGNDNTPEKTQEDALREEHDKDPEAFKEKYDVDPDKPYEPVPGNPADGAN